MQRSHYDYLIVGAGITSAVFAHEAAKIGKTCLVIDRRDHIAGNIYTEEIDGINVHKYGAHIFHTSLRPVWDYVNQFAEFNNYVNSPVARYKDELYNLPFNMNTFSKMWGIKTPAEAKEIIERQKQEAAEQIGEGEPSNLEEQALSLIGKDVFEKSSGARVAPSCPLPSSSACPCASSTTTTTSTIVGRASPWAVTRPWFSACSATRRFC